MTTSTLDEPLTQSADETSETPENPSHSVSLADTPAPSGAATAETSTVPPASDSPSASTASDDDDEDDDNDDPVLSLERDAIDFNKATITVVLQLLPHDGHADGRLVLLGVKSHNLAPLTITRRFAQLSPLPAEVAQLLTRWQDQYQEALAARTTKRAADKAKEKAKEEERKRKQEESRRNAKTKPAAKPAVTHTPAQAAPTPAASPAASAAPAEPVPQSMLF